MLIFIKKQRLFNIYREWQTENLNENQTDLTGCVSKIRKRAVDQTIYCLSSKQKTPNQHEIFDKRNNGGSDQIGQRFPACLNITDPTGCYIDVTQ